MLPTLFISGICPVILSLFFIICFFFSPKLSLLSMSRWTWSIPPTYTFCCAHGSLNQNLLLAAHRRASLCNICMQYHIIFFFLSSKRLIYQQVPSTSHRTSRCRVLMIDVDHFYVASTSLRSYKEGRGIRLFIAILTDAYVTPNTFALPYHFLIILSVSSTLREHSRTS